jgi:hypothetical protein
MATNKDFKVKNGIQLAGQLTSTVATGTAPLIVASTTLVTNLNADLLDGFQPQAGNVASSIVARDTSGNFSAGTITATLAGTATNITGTYAGTLTSLQVTNALTFTPYNATNPSGYTANAGTVTSVAALTLGTAGTDVSSTVATGTTTPVITLNIPTASATARGLLSAADWTTFNNKGSGGGTVTSVTGTGTVSGLTLSGTVTTTGSLTLGGTLSFATQAYGDATTNVATTAFVDQFRDVPANAQAGVYTLVLTDRGKCIDANGAITIPANTAVAFPIGTVIGFINVSAAAITIAITTDTLHLAGTATVGTRTLASWGMASMRKTSATVWVISGAGLT